MIKAGATYKHVDGYIDFLSESTPEPEGYAQEGLDQLAELEEHHFWFGPRRRLICNTVLRHLTPESSFLDIGGGTGVIALSLQQQGLNAALGEFHVNGLQYARSAGLKTCYRFNIYRNPFEDEFDALGMFDVLEHLERPHDGLMAAREMLHPGGYMFVTVPAHAWLWSSEDVEAGHFRRYTKRDISRDLSNAGFQIIDARYFYFSLVPLLFLRRVLRGENRGTGGGNDTSVKFEYSVKGITNSIMSAITSIDARISQAFRWPVGGSILVVAKKGTQGSTNQGYVKGLQ